MKKIIVAKDNNIQQPAMYVEAREKLRFSC